MKKTALVLSGGGSRGAYEIGVWEALIELGIKIDLVTGTSVGSINGAFVAQKDFRLAEGAVAGNRNRHDLRYRKAGVRL